MFSELKISCFSFFLIFHLQIYFNSTKEAYAEARKTNIIGYIYFAANFTESLVDVQDQGRNANGGSLITRDIEIRLDNSNQQISYFLERKLREIYRDFAQNLMIDCKLPIKLGNIPINFETPVYSTFDADFKQYAAPGVVMT